MLVISYSELIQGNGNFRTHIWHIETTAEIPPWRHQPPNLRPSWIQLLFKRQAAPGHGRAATAMAQALAARQKKTRRAWTRNPGGWTPRGVCRGWWTIHEHHKAHWNTEYHESTAKISRKCFPHAIDLRSYSKIILNHLLSIYLSI